MTDWVYFDAVCKDCKKPFRDHQPEFLLKQWQDKGQTFPSQCPACFQQWRREEEEKDMQAMYEAEVSEENLDAAVAAAGVKDGYRLTTPPIRFVAEWLWRNRDTNIVLSGTTGTGKSTSIGVLARNLIKEGKTVQVWYLTDLLDEWRFARCDNDNPVSIKDLFRRIEGTDYLIIDECADKAVNTESTQEFMFRLLEDVTNGSCHAKVLLLGNFYKGAVAEIFGDEAPAFRRLKEKFKCGRIDVVKKQIIQIFK